MICRQCGNDISLSNFLLNVDSPKATQTWNATFYRSPGVHVQELTNPLGSRFRVVSVRKAHCTNVDSVSVSDVMFLVFIVFVGSLLLHDMTETYILRHNCLYLILPLLRSSPSGTKRTPGFRDSRGRCACAQSARHTSAGCSNRSNRQSQRKRFPATEDSTR